MNQNNEYFLHIFNVQKGDSLILEFPGNRFGVIDCKYYDSQNTDDDPPALAYLKTRNVDHLEFICLSHPHLDHYHGLWKICQHYSENDRTFNYFIFPGISLKSIAESYEANSIRRYELTKLFIYSQQLAINNFKNKKSLKYFQWKPFVPDLNIHPFLDMEEMNIITFSPAEEAVAEVRAKLETGENVNWNHISMAWFLFFFHKKIKILFSGDMENYLWDRMFERYEGMKHQVNLKCDLIKIAHHGGKSSFSNELLRKITYAKLEEGESSAIISTGGTSHHPDEELLRGLLKNNVKLYCTNKGPRCRPLKDHLPKIKVKHENRLEKLLKTKKREREKQIKAYRNIKEKLGLAPKRNECSGDISFKITPQKNVEIFYQERNVDCFYKEQVMKSCSNV
jgi:beta-lactamase superfamily II metal-dependent hydrolase